MIEAYTLQEQAEFTGMFIRMNKYGYMLIEKLTGLETRDHVWVKVSKRNCHTFNKYLGSMVKFKASPYYYLANEGGYKLGLTKLRSIKGKTNGKRN